MKQNVYTHTGNITSCFNSLGVYELGMGMAIPIIYGEVLGLISIYSGVWEFRVR